MGRINKADTGDTLPIVDTTAVVKDPSDATKLVRIDAGAVATGNTRVITMPNNDVDLGSPTFVDVTFTDKNGTANSLSDVDHHVKDLNEELSTTKFAMTGGTTGGVYTITMTSDDSPVEDLEFIIEGKELMAASSAESIAVESLKGTDASPNNVYVYVQNDGLDVAEIAASNTSPDGGVVEHVDAVYMKLGSVSGSASNVYAVNNVNAFSTDRIESMLDRFKEQGTLYKSGMAITSDANSVAITTGAARHVLDAATTPALEVDSVTPVDNFFLINNAGTYITHTTWAIAEYSDGVAFATAQYMKVRMGIALDNPELTSARWHVIPQNGATTYNTAAKAWLDSANQAVTTPSDNIIKYAFIPICDVVVRDNAATYTLQADPNTGLYHRDVRGQTTGDGGGGGISPPPASTTVAGVVELAITAEIDTGTDATRAMPVDQFVASSRNVRYLIFPLIGSTTNTAADTDLRGDWEIPITGTILQSDTNKNLLKATNTTAGTTGTMVVDIHLNGTTIMTTNKLDIDTGEKTTLTAATQPDLTTTAIAAGDILTFDIDTIHTTAAKGLKVYMAIRET